MVSAVSRISQWSCEQLEASLLPRHGNTLKKTALYAWQFFKFCFLFPLAVATSSLSFALSPLSAKPIDPPLVAFAKHPEWKDPVEETPIPLDNVGFATADFQHSGPLKHPHTPFGQLYLSKHPERFNPAWKFLDMLDHPEEWIAPHEEAGAKTFRFSVSRDCVEPTAGQFDESLLRRLEGFCSLLQQKGIEAVVTLEHFNSPLYQELDTPEGRNSFVRYAERVSDRLHRGGVRTIMTFNEVGIPPFQGEIMGEFPPYHIADFEGAARRLESTLRTHTQVYHALKERHPDFSIGFSHDPIRFRYFHKIHPLWSPLERLTCEYLTRINHDMVMECLQTGKFHLKVPFRANYAFELPEKVPFDFFGLQYYTDPLLQLSVCGGDSVTRVPGEKTTFYRYRTYPQGLASALWELHEKFPGVPIRLSEIGLDTGVNLDASDRERILYFGKIFQVVQKALDAGIPVESLHLWTLYDDFDWYQAWGPPFGFFSYDPETGQSERRPVFEWLKNRISQRNLS